MANQLSTLKFLMFAKNNEEVAKKLKLGDKSPIDLDSDLDDSVKEKLKAVDWNELEIDIEEKDIKDFSNLGYSGNTIRAAAFVKTRLEDFFGI